MPNEAFVSSGNKFVGYSSDKMEGILACVDKDVYVKAAFLSEEQTSTRPTYSCFNFPSW